MDILPDTILYPVADLEAAKRTYTALLGTEPAVDSPYYVGYSVGGRDVGLVPGGDGTGPLPHFHVPDIVDTIAALVATGASERNWNGYGAEVELAKDFPDWKRKLLTDPQTSGGLLVACAPESQQQVLELFHKEGFREARVIGRLTGGAPRVSVT